jgi:uncharacterized membrane protein (DUF4010 family)
LACTEEAVIQFQERRGISYLVSNIAVSAASAAAAIIAFRSLPFSTLADPRFSARLILAFLALQIVVRFLVIVAFAIITKLRSNEDTVYNEDELDRLVWLKATAAFSTVLASGVGLSLLGLAIGLPLPALFVGLAVTVVASGLTLDCASLRLYRRGV